MGAVFISPPKKGIYLGNRSAPMDRAKRRAFSSENRSTHDFLCLNPSTHPVIARRALPAVAISCRLAPASVIIPCHCEPVRRLAHPRVVSLAPSGQFTSWQSVLLPPRKRRGAIVFLCEKRKLPRLLQKPSLCCKIAPYILQFGPEFAPGRKYHGRTASTH